MKEPKTKLNEHDLALFKRLRRGVRTTATSTNNMVSMFAALAQSGDTQAQAYLTTISAWAKKARAVADQVDTILKTGVCSPEQYEQLRLKLVETGIIAGAIREEYVGRRRSARTSRASHRRARSTE